MLSILVKHLRPVNIWLSYTGKKADCLTHSVCLLKDEELARYLEYGCC